MIKTRNIRIFFVTVLLSISIIVGIVIYHFVWYRDNYALLEDDIYYSFYLEGVASNTMPNSTSGYFFEQAICTNGASITWDSNTWSAKINNLTTSRTKCTLYFSKPANATLAKLQNLNPSIVLNTSMNNETGTCPSYDTTSKTITVTAGEDNASLLCEAEDDLGTSYYFRGNVTNNYVSFAGFIWRIVRINGDGSIRMIYDGTQAYANLKEGGSESDGTNRQIGTRAFNSSSNDNAYVGYMYKAVNQSSYADTFDVMNNKNATSSTIKGNSTTEGSVDYWYANNIDITIPSSTKKYSDYVSIDTIFCNDKNISETTPSGYTTDGYAKQKTAYRWYYGPWTAAGSGQQQPRFTCVNTQGTVDSKNDAFSASTTGNGALTYPVALLTTDEAVAAGGYSGTTSHYLRTGNLYWTLSPRSFYSSDAGSRHVYSTGNASNYDYVYLARGVRPVLSLKPDIEFSGGDGTMNNPFVILYN